MDRGAGVRDPRVTREAVDALMAKADRDDVPVDEVHGAISTVSMSLLIEIRDLLENVLEKLVAKGEE